MKKYFTIFIFTAVIVTFSLAGLLLPDNEISVSERRRLAEMPKSSIVSSEFSEELETYMLDQFPLREGFRTINAITRFYVYLQSDVNGIWLKDGYVYKSDAVLDEKQILLTADKINKVTEMYLSGANQVFYSVIPDKNYYVDDSEHITSDFPRITEMLRENIEDAEYIDISNTLSQNSYYRTDSHWSQDKIFPAAQKISESLGVSEYMTPLQDYKTHALYPFNGVYMGQAALPVSPDTLYYLTSKYTDTSYVTGIEGTESPSVYDETRIDGLDGYDVFLSGAQAVLTIECPNAKTSRELVIFRDSFGSSIAPLFLGAYSKVTLIDLRYIASSLVDDYVSFEDCDALFLYSSAMVSSGAVLR